MSGYERSGDLATAMSVADEIVRLEPSSVKHHQKRVEYAYRSNDRPQLVEAYLALGMSLNSAEKFSEAVSPLEAYVKVQPGDPAGHYQLATAYARTGRKPEADRQIALQRETAATSPRSDQR